MIEIKISVLGIIGFDTAPIRELISIINYVAVILTSELIHIP